MVTPVEKTLTLVTFAIAIATMAIIFITDEDFIAGLAKDDDDEKVRQMAKIRVNILKQSNEE